MQLVVTEKPSVAQAISHVIGAKERKDGYMEGNGFLVSWCVGHLVELAQPEMYSEAWKKWSYESLPMIPEQWQHEVKKETATQYKILKNLMHDTRVESVVCATDAGREGELIFRLVYEQAGCRKPMKRLWISSMEESAIRDGFENLKPGSDYDSLYQSALCRQQADWLVGLNGTRLFTVLYGGKVLKVGRVQTPTLAMLVDREVKIMNFEKEQYYMAHILMDGIDAMTERIDDKARAESIAAACESQSGVVRSVIKENKSVGIEDMVRELVQTYHSISDDQKSLFGTMQEVLGKCPKCGSDVVKGKFGAYCKQKCGMNVGRAMGATFSDTQMKSLLEGKKTLVRGLKGKKGSYDAYLIPEGIEDYSYIKDGKEIKGSQYKFKMEFPPRKSK